MAEQFRSLEAYKKACEESVADPEGFWSRQAEHFVWSKRWTSVLNWDFDTPNVRWFEGAQLNITENCLDRHIAEKGDYPAIIWESNDPNEPNRIYSYQQLLDKVCQAANALKSLGISKGDRIVFYMPMIPELAIAVLACARIGAIHSVVFAGFSAQALADRINDAEAKLIICSDLNYRGDKKIPVKQVVDDAMLIGCPSVDSILVVQQESNTSSLTSIKDIDWHSLVDVQSTDCAPVQVSSEDMLFILYTSGSTGKPKGVVHTCGGYMVYVCYSFLNVFQYQSGDVYWCTADVGWITGHSYIIYGPLLAGATTVMFEGVPTFPDAGRFWQVCEKLKVNQFYTAPTAIRALMAKGNSWPAKYDLTSLKVLGSVGEPINEEAWHWYDQHIGQSKVPIVDTWWQTETGGIMITPFPGITDSKPTYASYPMPGVQAILVDPNGQEIADNNAEGLLCIKFPWPSMLRTTYGDHERCRQTYFSAFKGLYFTGDGARRDHEGRIRVIGRVDDVINVSGHRMGTAEVENAINEHPNVVESAVVGVHHDIKGQGIYAFVVCDRPVNNETALTEEIKQTVNKEIGPIAKPDYVQFVTGLPKTRSGKIMRRILRKITANEIEGIGDISTLLNPEIVEEIIEGSKTKQA